MLPTMNLQLTELPQFDTNTGTFTPDGADEPTALFADVLAVRSADRPATGESLPRTGNALPLMPEPLSANPEVSAEIVLESGQPLTPDADSLAPESDGIIAPYSVVEDAEVLEVTLELQPIPDAESPIRPIEESAAGREAGIPLSALPGKGLQPAVPPGPMDLGDRSGKHTLLPETGALARDAVPQTGADALRRPIMAATAPSVVAESDGDDPLAQSGPLRSPLLEVPAARTAEPRMPVMVETAAIAPEPTRLVPEPLTQAVQTAQPTTQNPAAIVDAIAEGVAELRSANDTAPLARTVAEPLSPRQAQSILQPINTPVQQPDWDRAVSERVVMMANNKLQHAEIRLTPAELGPLRVQVSVDDGAANVSFQAQHAMTRDAIEQALPRLRELFAENGLSLGQTSVGQEGAADGDDARSSDVETASAEGLELSAEETKGEVVRSRVESGLVDTFV